jgi:hypothetical protein
MARGGNTVVDPLTNHPKVKGLSLWNRERDCFIRPVACTIKLLGS